MIIVRTILWLLLAGGVAAVAVHALKPRTVSPRPGEKRSVPPQPWNPPRDVTVHVTYGRLSYSEGARSLTLYWEPLVGDRRPLLYVPTERLWSRIMPDWAKQRRVEIIHNVQARTPNMRFEVYEYDQDGGTDSQKVVNRSR